MGNARYWPIGSTSQQTLSVDLAALALNIATDWVPHSPRSVAPGLTNLLAEVLEPEAAPPRDWWLARQELLGFERQWRAVTSYMLATAFTVEVVQGAGYNWWVPVSFYRQNRNPLAPFSWFSPFFSIQQASVSRVPGSGSKLMPDFLLARLRSTGGYEIGFAESKGTTLALTGLSTVPYPWGRQARNAEFRYKGASILPAQSIVVATRIQPQGRRRATRRVQVRAWNNAEESGALPIDALAELLTVHYAGIMHQLDLQANLRLLQMAAQARAGDRAGGPPDPQAERRGPAGTEEARRAAEEELRNLRAPRGLSCFGKPQNQFPVGDQRLVVGFSQPLLYLVRALQYGEELSEHRLARISEEIDDKRRWLAHEGRDVMVRRDGMMAFLES